jgi:hypothetical protein
MPSTHPRGISSGELLGQAIGLLLGGSRSHSVFDANRLTDVHFIKDGRISAHARLHGDCDIFNLVSHNSPFRVAGLTTHIIDTAQNFNANINFQTALRMKALG